MTRVRAVAARHFDLVKDGGSNPSPATGTAAKKRQRNEEIDFTD